MKELLHQFFTELGMTECAKGVSECTHNFSLKIYMQLFNKELNKKDTWIVSKKRANEIEYQFFEEVKKFNEQNRYFKKTRFKD